MLSEGRGSCLLASPSCSLHTVAMQHCSNVATMFKSSVCTATKHIVGGFTKRASVVRWQAWQCDPLTNQSSTNLPSHNFPCKAMIACTSITQDFKFVYLSPAAHGRNISKIPLAISKFQFPMLAQRLMYVMYLTFLTVISIDPIIFLSMLYPCQAWSSRSSAFNPFLICSIDMCIE